MPHPHPQQGLEDLARSKDQLREAAHRDTETALLLADWASETTPHATHHCDITPLPTNGNAVPVPQPGRPPMSQRATDHASLVLAYSLGSVPVGGSLSLVLWAVASVPTEILAIAALAPVGLVGAIGITARLIGRAVADGATALPDTHTHHHTGPTYIQHTQLRTRTTGFGRTVNQLPDGQNR